MLRDPRPEVDLIDDKEGKPVGIQSRIGRRLIAAFGNSDGNLQMLQWATTAQAQQRARGLSVWKEPMVTLRAPLIINLHALELVGAPAK